MEQLTRNVSLLTAVPDNSYHLSVFVDPGLGNVVLQVHLPFSRDIHDIQG
jgi:hypothetical protein